MRYELDDYLRCIKKKNQVEYIFTTQRAKKLIICVTRNEGLAADTVLYDTKIWVKMIDPIHLDDGKSTRGIPYKCTKWCLLFLGQLNKMSNDNIKTKCWTACWISFWLPRPKRTVAENA